ncbi:hypothetical protein L4C33_22445, partial [Vibrio makurazakiensis]|uniref:LON peptidase substrate-binding domain-containing protein n=1 Tax=Vibrio makurazakiensis TaxID=2910250 RepID=UPI003D0AEDBA
MTTPLKMKPQKTALGSHSVNRLPIFPLPIFLLVGGMQRLRVFEPKYISMVATAAKGEGFVICMDEKKDLSSTEDWGAHVNIVDFDMGKDGVLIIDVLAQRLVNLTQIESQANGLLTGQVDTLIHWSAESGDLLIEDGNIAFLSDTLKAIFSAHPELSFLYKQETEFW